MKKTLLSLAAAASLYLSGCNGVQVKPVVVDPLKVAAIVARDIPLDRKITPADIQKLVADLLEELAAASTPPAAAPESK